MPNDRKKYLNVRVSELERERVMRLASDDDVDASTYIRRFVNATYELRYGHTPAAPTAAKTRR
jgi:hypothetical protein